MDRRDGVDLEAPWIECAGKVGTAWEQLDSSPETASLIQEIQKQSFLAVSRATNQHEMASYVSDDFEMIAKAIVLNLEDGYFSSLLKQYQSGLIPGAEPRK